MSHASLDLQPEDAATVLDVEPPDTLRILRYTEEMDIFGEVYWHVTSDGVKFYIRCNDLFTWGAADAQAIAASDWQDLQDATDRCEALTESGEVYGRDLWCAQKRGMRPQGAAYPAPRDLWSLFDACGPEREIGLGNPKKPGEA